MREVRRFLPTRVVVTVLTLFSLLAFVHVIIQMACSAVRLQTDLEYGFDVTIVTGDGFVRAAQHIVGIAIVVETRVLPFHGDMTSLAFLAAVTVVMIIFEMADSAAAIHLISEGILTMAILTGCLTMAAFKREVSIATVIETRIVPGNRVMAVATLVPASSFVIVVVLVAGIAVSRRAQVGRILVAVEAGRFNMLAEQREVGSAVIKFRVLPIGGVMAVCAGSTKTVLVNVVFPMAVNAVTSRITMLVVGLVAVDADGIKMFADEFEVGESMVKCLLIQTDYVGVSAFMIGMAGRTFLRADVVGPAMKSCFAVDVRGNILMTVKAESSLF